MKFNWKMSKDKWLILAAGGLLLLVLAIPSGNKSAEKAGGQPPLLSGIQESKAGSITTAAKADRTYEEQLERRVKQLLKTVDGVGEVDVMIVLKSSEEKVLRVDKEASDSSSEEQDSTGGTRKTSSREERESTILTGSGDGASPIVEKELKPQIAGIVISADGGNSPSVKAEISGAMEALFDIPPHKIKVLKRVE